MLCRKAFKVCVTSLTGRCFIRTFRRHLSVIFYGSDEFSVRSLECLLANKDGISTQGGLRISRLEVVCKEKYLPVKKFALNHNLPVHEWPYVLPQGSFDVGVVVSFGHLIPRESIESCLHGMVNVHPSLLPRWRGAAPEHHTIINDDQVTGISIVDVAPDHFDVGRVLLQEKLTVPDRCTLSQLSDILAERGGQLLLRSLSDLEHYRANSWAQDNSEVTRAPKVTQDMARVQWSSVTARQVDCLQRGLPFPLHTYWKGRKVRLLQMLDPERTSQIQFERIATAQKGLSLEPGWCVFDRRNQVLGIMTGADGGWVAFGQVVIRQTMSSKDFYNGYISKVPPDQRFFSEAGENDSLS